MTKKANVAVIIYSMYHHVFKMATAVKAGIDASGCATATLYRVSEILPKDVLEKMHAPEHPDLPLATPNTMKEADAIMFGFPTRFGMIPAQFKAYLDSTGGLWQAGSLQGKPCGLFSCTAGQHGGQETTIMSTMPYLAHLGMVYVPFGYSHPSLSELKEASGGAPWGATTLAAADGSRQPTAAELDTAKTQGTNFGKFAGKLVNSTL